MSGTNHQEYQRIIREIDCFFGRMGIGFKEKTRNLCLFFCNQVHCAVQQLLLLYYVIYQPSDPLVKSQQIWATIAMIQVFVKVYNRLLHSKEMEILLEYFEGIYTGTIKEEYQMVLDKHLNAQNRQIKTAFWYLAPSEVSLGFIPHLSSPQGLQTHLVRSWILLHFPTYSTANWCPAHARHLEWSAGTGVLSPHLHPTLLRVFLQCLPLRLLLPGLRLVLCDLCGDSWPSLVYDCRYSEIAQLFGS